MERSMARPERPHSRRTLIELEHARDAPVARDLWNDRRLESLVIGMSQAEKLARLDRAAASLRP